MATDSTRTAPDLGTLERLEFPIVHYEVCREKIAEYVAAIGDRNPIHSDPGAARALGYRDIVAPPTFAAVFATLPVRRALADREWLERSTIDPARILHGEQRFDFKRSLAPGDRLIVQSIVREITEKKDLVILVLATRIENERGERMLDGTTTLLLRT